MFDLAPFTLREWQSSSIDERKKEASRKGKRWSSIFIVMLPTCKIKHHNVEQLVTGQTWQEVIVVRKKMSPIERGQFFGNCCVKTAKPRRIVASHAQILYSLLYSTPPSPLGNFVYVDQWLTIGSHKGMIGSPPINQGLQEKSDSCAGFYREDEWVDGKMAYIDDDVDVAGVVPLDENRIYVLV